MPAVIEKPDTETARVADVSPDSSWPLLVRAREPETPAHVLRDLAGREAPRVRQAVAAHPNTPVRVLLRLAEEVPVAFLKNPVVRLLFLEDPAFLSRLSTEALRSVLEADAEASEMPASWLRWASRHEDAEVRSLTARHSGTPSGVLKRLAGDAHPFVRTGAVGNDKLPIEDAALLYRDPAHDVREQLAKRPALPPPYLRSLARNVSQSVRARVATNPNTPREVLRRLDFQVVNDFVLWGFPVHRPEPLLDSTDLAGPGRAFLFPPSAREVFKQPPPFP